jgi:O-antigen/teichoic acid export membrane protein
MTKHPSRSFLKGAFILSLAGLISKIISAGYRIPLQNLTGDYGFYIYQQVYPILGIALILSLYGFPAAISKVVSELISRKKELSISSFFFPVFGWLMAAGGFIFLIGYFQSPWIASVMGDEKLTPSLRAAFAVFLLVPFVSILRGVFQGNNEMSPTAFSQIIEQIFRVGVIICTAFFVMNGGDVYRIGIGASVGSMLGASASFLFLFYWMSKNKRWWTWQRWQDQASYKKTIFLHGVLICLNYMLLLSLQLVDALTLVPNLLEAGVNLDKARVMKGVFDRGQPLIQLGTVLASSIALALIPSVSSRRMIEEPARVKKSIMSAVKMTVLICFAATAGLIFLFPAINQSFFQDGQGTGYLRVLMLVIIGSSISITLSSVLQGLGYVKQTAWVIVGGLVVKLIANEMLVSGFQAYGAAVASTIAVTFVLFGNIVILRHEIPVNKWFKLPWKPLFLSLSGMVIGLYMTQLFIDMIIDLNGRTPLFIYTLLLTGVGAMIYFFLLLRTGAFTKEEIQIIPSYKWLAKLLPKGMNQ